MIERSLIGRTFPEYGIEVEKQPLRFFATAIGDLDPIRHDEHAARAAGYRSLVAPPTYVACLGSIADPDPGAPLKLLGVDLGRILHGEERLRLHRPVCAGDRLRFSKQIADIYSKKNGALEFVVLATTARDEQGETVAETYA